MVTKYFDHVVLTYSNASESVHLKFFELVHE